jgi:hypothetical protein
VRDRAARICFALTAVAVLVGLVTQLIVTATSPGGFFTDTTSRTLNLFAYFTIQSNIIVGVTCGLLAVRPNRESTVFRVFRLDGLLCITVTFVVFRVALAGLHDLHGGAAFADFMLHGVVPVLCVFGWVAFGPHGTLTTPVAAWSTVFPLAWLAFTLIRGAFIDWYPYPFIDVVANGYGTVSRNCLFIAVFFVALAAGATALDRLLSRRSVLSRR